MKVILGRSGRDRAGSTAKHSGGTNEMAAKVFSKGGVEVRFDKGSDTMHGKLIIIDGTVVITGSHNLSDTALNKNFEYTNLVRSRKHVENILAMFWQS